MFAQKRLLTEALSEINTVEYPCGFYPISKVDDGMLPAVIIDFDAFMDDPYSEDGVVRDVKPSYMLGLFVPFNEEDETVHEDAMDVLYNKARRKILEVSSLARIVGQPIGAQDIFGVKAFGCAYLLQLPEEPKPYNVD